MPVYEYECKACGRDFEYQQRMVDPDKTTCEVCGGSLERLISRTAFSLKGGGWYKDLYASPKPAEAKSDAKPDTAKSDAPAASADKPAASPSSSSSDSGGKSNTGSGGSGSGGSGSGAGGSGAGGGSGGSSAAAAKAS